MPRSKHSPTNGSKVLTITPGSSQYACNQPLIFVAWTCGFCGKYHERFQRPGTVPKYCPAPAEAKQSDCQRAARQRHMK